MKSYKELEEKCAYCGENMYTIVRAHHHTEIVNGREQDVTKENYLFESPAQTIKRMENEINW